MARAARSGAVNFTALDPARDALNGSHRHIRRDARSPERSHWSSLPGAYGRVCSLHARRSGAHPGRFPVLGRWLSGSIVLAAIASLLFAAPTEMASPLSAQVTAPGVVAMRNATIITASRGTINNGTIVMRDGKIAAVGAERPDSGGRADRRGTGKFVSPGIIDAHSHIANDAINEGATAVSSMTGMGDVLNPLDISIQRDLAGGVTTANILHGSANPIGGKTVVIKLRWGVTRASDLLLPGRAARHQVRAR